MKVVKVPRAHYLGGLPHDPKATIRANASLFISEEGIGVGFLKPTQGKVAWEQMAGISFGGGQVSKSKVGAAVMFGVLGALASQGTQDRAEMTIQLKDGTEALYYVLRVSVAALRGKLLGAMTEKSVRCLDDGSESHELRETNAAKRQLPSTESVASSISGEIAKLNAFHKEGVLTDEEFATAKANLLNP
jgi:hypothetical protein